MAAQGKAEILKGARLHCRKEARELALDCTAEITAAPRMLASFINFIAAATEGGGDQMPARSAVC